MSEKMELPPEANDWDDEFAINARRVLGGELFREEFEEFQQRLQSDCKTQEQLIAIAQQ